MRTKMWKLAARRRSHGAGVAAPARADVLYDQPTDFNGAFSSQNDTNVGGFGNFATVYDNFTLAADSTVTDVHWVGSYFNGNPAQITAFTVTIYSDAAGQPGAALNTSNVLGNANETSLGTDNFGDPVFSYGINLTTSFAAAAGTQYWLSIVPDIGFPPQWGWETGTGGDGLAFQDFFGSRAPLGSDLAFSLTGTPLAVPEPSALVSAGLGTLCLLGFARRRRAVA